MSACCLTVYAKSPGLDMGGVRSKRQQKLRTSALYGEYLSRQLRWICCSKQVLPGGRLWKPGKNSVPRSWRSRPRPFTLNIGQGDSQPINQRRHIPCPESVVDV